VNINANIHTQNDGLQVLLARRSGQFGIDSVFGATQPDDYITTASYQKVNRNPISTSIGIQYDNAFESHQIPRTPAGYSWVRAALAGSSGSFSYMAGGLPATIPSGTTSTAIPFATLDTKIEQFSLLDQLYRTPLGYPNITPEPYTLLETFSGASVTRGFLNWAGPGPIGALPSYLTANTGTTNAGGEIRHDTGSNRTAYRFAGGYHAGWGAYPYLASSDKERALRLSTWLSGELQGDFFYGQGDWQDFAGTDLLAGTDFNLHRPAAGSDAEALRLQYTTTASAAGSDWTDILVLTSSALTDGNLVGWLTGSLAFAGPSGSAAGLPYQIRWAQLGYGSTAAAYPGTSLDNWAVTNINLVGTRAITLPTSAQITSSFYASMIDVGSTEIQNTLSTRSAVIGPADFIVYTDAINNGLFGYTSFVQTRGGDTRQARSMKENNIFSFSYPGTRTTVNGVIPGADIVRNINMPPVVENYPLQHVVTTRDDVKMDMNYTFGNEYEFYPLTGDAERILYAISGVDKTKRNRKTTFNFISSLYVDPQVNGVSVEYNKLNYKQNIWPKSQFTYRNENRQRTQFAINWWSSGRTTRNRTNVTNSLGNPVSSQSIWVVDGVSDTSDQPKDLFIPYTSSLVDEYSKKYIFSAGELNNDCMLNYTVVGGPLSSSINNQPVATNTLGAVMMEAKIKPSILYARPFTVMTASSLLLTVTGATASAQVFVPSQIVGGVPWSAASEAGKEPFFYKDYNDYILDLRTAGKDYSIIPEFRISETIASIITGPSGSNTVLTPTFDITGAFYPNDSTDSFYTEFINSDFLKYFSIIKDKHTESDIESRGTLKLSCNALKKFLPYEGFYPAQRVDQIGVLFSQSYGDIITITGSGNPMATGTINAGGSFRTAIIPFFAPGILCNSIKSGVGLGYPVFTSSFDVVNQVTGTYMSASKPPGAGVSRFDKYGARLSASYDTRLPFESITDPLAYITQFVDAEPNENAFLYSTASYNSGTSGDDRYRYAVNNFLAETMNLFLKNRAPSAIISSGENAWTFDTTKEYRMDVRIFEEGMSMYSGDKSFGPPMDDSELLNGSRASFLPYLPPYDVKAGDKEEGVTLIFNPISDTHSVDYVINNLTRSFLINDSIPVGDSLAVDNRTKITDTINFSRKVKVGESSVPVPGAPEFAFSIQPKFETPILDFSHRTASISVTNLQSSMEFKVVDYAKVTPGDVITFGNGNVPITFTVAAAYSASAGEFDGSGGTSLAFLNSLKTLIEDPAYTNAQSVAYNFDVVVADPFITLTAKACGELPNLRGRFVEAVAGAYSMTTTNGTGFYDCSSAADNYYVGMWHQYGRIPTGSQGIKLQVTDPIITATTSSLADILGLDKTPVKLGQLASTTVKEAIVAVPYTVVDDTKQFFKIDERSFRLAAFGSPSAASEMPADFRNLAEKMKNYVFPPRMDFYHRTNEVSPFAMFIFEFGLELDAQDLADIWQNLPPTSNVGKRQLNSRIEKEESSFEASYGTEDSWFPAGLPEGTRWMVFKAKQRAAYDYFEQTRKSSLAQGKANELEPLGAFTNPTYSYNWPYDFFSFVELAKTTAEIKLDNNLDAAGEEMETPSLRERAAEEAARGAERGRERATRTDAEEDATSGAPPAGVAASRRRGGGFFTGE
jgi:hypothetical protein